jgi:hypothetical protein
MAEREYRSTHPPDWIKRRRSVAARATNHMPRSLIGIAIILVASSVGAQTCYTFEYTTTCNNGISVYRFGNVATFSDGTTAYRSGNITPYNDGRSSYRYGKHDDLQ